MDSTKPTRGTWYSAPKKLASTRDDSRALAPVINTSLRPSAAPSLPGFASFLPLCRSLTTSMSLRPPTSTSTTYSPVHTSCNSTAAYSAIKLDSAVSSSANSSYQTPYFTTVSSHSTAPPRATTCSNTMSSTTSAGASPAFSKLPVVSASQQNNSSVFFPVGVVMKNTPAATPYQSSGSSLNYQHCGPRSSCLYYCGATAAPPLWLPGSVAASTSPLQSHLNSAVKQFMPVPQAREQLTMTQNQDRLVGQSEVKTSVRKDYLYHAQPSPPPLYDVHRDVSTDPFHYTAGECVSNNISVVTLRAPDTSLFMANHAGTTSQTESEFSLQDVKMHLTVKKNTASEPPPPPPPSPSVCCAVSQPTSYDISDESHPGLDMLSDVSLFMKSMASCDGASEGRTYNKDLLKRTSMATSFTSESHEVGRDPDTLLSKPCATYVGTIQSGTDSSIDVDSSQVHYNLHSEIDPQNTQMNMRHPSPIVQDVVTLHNYTSKHLGPSKPYTLVLPPKKSSKFTTKAVSDHTPDNRGNGDLVLKISRNVIDDATPRRRRPRKKNDKTEMIARTTCEDRTTQKEGLTRIKLSQSNNCRAKTADATENMKQKFKQHAHSVIPFQQTEKRSSKTNTDGRKSKSRLKTTKQTARADSSNNVKNMADQPNVKNMADQPKTVAQNFNSDSSKPHGAKDFYGGILVQMSDPAVDDDTTHLTSEVLTVSSQDSGLSTDGAHDAGAGSEDADFFSAANQSSPDFDPLAIVEEEVTSSQPQGEQEKPAVPLQTRSPCDEHKSRRRSHICVSCFAIPSSSDDSTPSSPNPPAHLPVKKKERKSDEGFSVDTENKSSPKVICSLPCEVCGRKYANRATLTRHKRLFHPSLFSNKTGIVELPFVSSCSPSLPLSPSSILSAMSQDTPASPLWSTIPKSKTLTSESDKKPEDDVSKPKVEGEKQKRKTYDSDEDMWEPNIKRQPKKKKTAMSERKGSEKNRAGQKNDSKGNVEGRAVRQKQATAEGKTRRKSVTSLGRLTRILNFRTKKRTRINSTILCPYCDRTFSVMSNLKRHTKQQHDDVFVFVCSVCSQKFNMRRTLKKHYRRLHALEFPALCRECLACFRSQPEMREHQRSHMISKFPCDDCNLMFYTQAHFRDHMAQHHVTISDKISTD